MTQQARLAGVATGSTPADDGWFVVDAGQAAWLATRREPYADRPHRRLGWPGGWDELPFATQRADGPA